MKYPQRIFNRFVMVNYNTKAIPRDLNINKSNNTNSKELINNRFYREIIGSLIYAMAYTRLDLCSN